MPRGFYAFCVFLLTAGSLIGISVGALLGVSADRTGGYPVVWFFSFFCAGFAMAWSTSSIDLQRFDATKAISELKPDNKFPATMLEDTMILMLTDESSARRLGLALLEAEPGLAWLVALAAKRHGLVLLYKNAQLVAEKHKSALLSEISDDGITFTVKRAAVKVPTVTEPLSPEIG